MYFNNYLTNDYEFNECMSKGACSISPDITSLQEVMLIFLRQLAFYELKLDEMDAEHFTNREIIMSGVIMLVYTKDYSDEQILALISRLYTSLINARRLYIETCEKKEVKCEDLKFALKLTPQMTLTAIIGAGEKAFLEKYKKISPAQKNMTDILILVIKSICTNLVILQTYTPIGNSAYVQVLKGLSLLNYSKISLDKIKRKIDELAKVDLELVALRNRAQKNHYGNIQKKEVSLSTESGKAILVSGANFQNLYDILEATENKDIHVYSHADLLISHAFSGFNKFKHFKGHYGNCMDNCILDYATFPGAILLTKNSARNLEYLYRGRLFSAEALPPKGVVQIKDNNFEPLIESALNAKGFVKGREMGNVTVGYDNDLLMKKIDNIAEKIKNGEIERLFFIGMSNYSSQQSDYFNKLLKLLPKNSYVISLSYNNESDNVLYINLANNLPMAFSVLNEISKKIDLTSNIVTFFLTKCDVNSITNMICLKNSGAKNIYLSKCPPIVISPTILNTLSTLYNIKHTTFPGADLEDIITEKETDS